MPSPFPGMDPYLESPDIWPDFHDALAGEIRAALNHALPAPYYARLEMRPEVGIVDEDFGSRRIIPDVAVARSPRLPANGGVAVQELPRATISDSFEVEVKDEALRHHFVEIRDSARGHRLVTLIEIVSPSNKRKGPDRLAYLKKQNEILESTANLVEIDLLRTGKRLLPHHDLVRAVASRRPRPDYLMLVNRAWRRAEGSFAYQIFPAVITESLPVIPIPLKEGEAETPLDLQYVFHRAYDAGPYRRGAVDYSLAPSVAINDALMPWCEECLRRAGWRS